MGKYVHIEGRDREAIIVALAFFLGAPIDVFPMDEDCIRVVITFQVSVVCWVLL